MQIVLLDADTLGPDIDITCMQKFGELTSYPQTLTREDALQRSVCAEIIITNKVLIDANFIDANPQLKLVCITATGTNNVDMEYAARKNIAVKNVSGYSTQSVTQHTFTALLSLIGKSSYYDAFVKSGDYARSSVFVHYGPLFSEIHAKTFGIIGLGNIGKSVARVAAAFGAKVIYFSASGQNRSSDFERVELDVLLRESDFVSIHSPLNNATKNLIGKKEMEDMKKTAILINMGRGGIVDEAALAEAIDNEEIGGTVLDVFLQEPLSPESPLLKIQKSERVLFTPHIAWASQESRQELLRKVCQNIADFLQV